MKRISVWLLFGASLYTAAALTQAQTPPRKISGEVVALEGASLRIKSTSGETLTIRLADPVRVSVRAAADLSQVVSGAYIGTTAAPKSDGTLVASEIHIFPEAMRGTGEGHRPMETVSRSTMTNATVTRVTARDTMTNATVARVGIEPATRTLTLTYKGGEKVVVVPDTAPVMTIEPGDRSLLVPGARVVVYASTEPDGSLLAQRVSVGKNGYIPPL